MEKSQSSKMEMILAVGEAYVKMINPNELYV